MSGEGMATEKIWEQLSAELRRFLRSRIGDEQVADDLLQETFLRIHQRLGTLEDETRLASWVFQIARNLLTDYYRGKGRAAGALTSDVAAEEAAEENANEQVMQCMAAMIEQLPQGYREALKLYEIEGVRQQEIAGRMGISLSGAKSRVQRGREKLKGLLVDCCRFERDRRGNVIDFGRRGSDASCDACGA
jgi:RNA polymerase sigma-70 factor (ECF subfamily)